MELAITALLVLLVGRFFVYNYLEISPLKYGVRTSVLTASRTPRSWVEPPVAHFSPTSERPRRINRNARVTIKDGKPVPLFVE